MQLLREGRPSLWGGETWRPKEHCTGCGSRFFHGFDAIFAKLGLLWPLVSTQYWDWAEFIGAIWSVTEVWTVRFSGAVCSLLVRSPRLTSDSVMQCEGYLICGERAALTATTATEASRTAVGAYFATTYCICRHRCVCVLIQLLVGVCAKKINAVSKQQTLFNKKIGLTPTERERASTCMRNSWVCSTGHYSHVSSLGGYPVAATSAVRVFAAARRAAHSSSDSRRPSVRCCRSDALEQSATRHYWLCVTDVILPETENFCFLYHFYDYIFFFFSGPWGLYLGHFKISFVCMCTGLDNDGDILAASTSSVLHSRPVWWTNPASRLACPDSTWVVTAHRAELSFTWWCAFFRETFAHLNWLGLLTLTFYVGAEH